MIVYNGLVKENDLLLSTQNRGLKFGDSLFETMRLVKGRIKFWEDHYFRLMAGMRIMRMEIPMSFTPDFLENQVKELCHRNAMEDARIRLTIIRKQGGLYSPKTNKIDFIIETDKLQQKSYQLVKTDYKVDLFKDFKKNKSLLSTLKSNNKLEHIIAAVYAQENELDNVLLLNSNNALAEAINANIFIVNQGSIVTPADSEGCVKGIIRKKLIQLIKEKTGYNIIEREISPFELMKAEEVFLTNIIMGIRPVTQFRKKNYDKTDTAEKLIDLLNHAD